MVRPLDRADDLAVDGADQRAAAGTARRPPRPAGGPPPAGRRPRLAVGVDDQEISPLDPAERRADLLGRPPDDAGDPVDRLAVGRGPRRSGRRRRGRPGRSGTGSRRRTGGTSRRGRSRRGARTAPSSRPGCSRSPRRARRRAIGAGRRRTSRATPGRRSAPGGRRTRRAGRRSSTSRRAIWLRRSWFAASCRRRTSGQWADSSRPIPAKWFPMPGKTNARPEPGPSGRGEKATRSPGRPLASSSPATLRRAVAIPSRSDPAPSATIDAASLRAGSPGWARHHSAARASIGRLVEFARPPGRPAPGATPRHRPLRSRTARPAGVRSAGAGRASSRGPSARTLRGRHGPSCRRSPTPDDRASRTFDPVAEPVLRPSRGDERARRLGPERGRTC